MPKRKCVICEGFIENNDSYTPYKGRYAHQNCFNIAMKTLQKDKVTKLESQKKTPSKAKPKAELKDCLSEEEYKDKTDFYNYVRTLTEDNQLSAKIYVVVDNYIKRYDFTYRGMYNTLHYLNEYTDKVITGDIVGIIPYYYDEAQLFYKNLDLLYENNKDINFDNMYNKRVIKVSTEHKSFPQINIEDI